MILAESLIQYVITLLMTVAGVVGLIFLIGVAWSYYWKR